MSLNSWFENKKGNEGAHRAPCNVSSSKVQILARHHFSGAAGVMGLHIVLHFHFRTITITITSHFQSARGTFCVLCNHLPTPLWNSREFYNQDLRREFFCTSISVASTSDTLSIWATERAVAKNVARHKRNNWRQIKSGACVENKICKSKIRISLMAQQTKHSWEWLGGRAFVWCIWLLSMCVHIHSCTVITSDLSSPPPPHTLQKEPLSVFSR